VVRCWQASHRWAAAQRSAQGPWPPCACWRQLRLKMLAQVLCCGSLLQPAQMHCCEDLPHMAAQTRCCGNLSQMSAQALRCGDVPQPAQTRCCHNLLQMPAQTRRCADLPETPLLITSFSSQHLYQLVVPIHRAGWHQILSICRRAGLASRRGACGRLWQRCACRSCGSLAVCNESRGGTITAMQSTRRGHDWCTSQSMTQVHAFDFLLYHHICASSSPSRSLADPAGMSL